MKLFVGILLTIVTAATLMRADAASMLTAIASATQPSYSGACPATITLLGEVDGGVPNAPIQYTFRYWDTAANKMFGVPVRSAMTDSTGTIRVMAPVSFNASGASWVGLLARQPGTRVVAAPRSPLSITCTNLLSQAPPPNTSPTTPTSPTSSSTGTSTISTTTTVTTPPPDMSAPSAGSSFGDQPHMSTGEIITRGIVGLFVHKVMPKSIAAPKLSLLTNPADCMKHVELSGALAAPFQCQSAFDQGKPVLVWDWTLAVLCPISHVCPPIQGYRIYDMTALVTPPAPNAAAAPNAPPAPVPSPGPLMSPSPVSSPGPLVSPAPVASPLPSAPTTTNLAAANIIASIAKAVLIDTEPKGISISAPAAGKCFAVTAYNGSDESPLSNVVCVP